MNYDYYRIKKPYVHELNEHKEEAIFDSCENGFLKGNMSMPLFDPYENYPIGKLKATDENMYRAYNFAAIDLGLYLDTHPTSKEALTKFAEANEKRIQYARYLAQNGYPLTTCEVQPGMNYEWLNSFCRKERD